MNFYDAFNQLEIMWSQQGDWIVEYAQNQTRYGDLNVSFSSDSIILEPGSAYVIRSITADSNRIKNKDRSQLNGEDHDLLLFMIITILLLIITLVVYRLFKAATKRK